MKLTVIISYYKALKNLKLILGALNNQSETDFEVIVSEDDANDETINFLAGTVEAYRFPITHLHQVKDDGFRKNQMLNRSLLMAKCEKLAFIDGDCVPHKHFVREYVKHIKDDVNCIYSGRAVFLDDKKTAHVLENQSFNDPKLLSLFFTKSTNIKDSIYSPTISITLKPRGIIGRNWGILKQLLLDVNGFDEDYVFAGIGEDSDIEWRLIENGATMKSMKNKAIVYHLHHPKSYSEEKVRANFEIMNHKKSLNLVKCLNGIEKLSETTSDFLQSQARN